MTIPVTHLVKGYLSADLRAMVRPAAQIRLVTVPRPLFRVSLWWFLVWRTLVGRIQWVLLDHERTLREISWWCRTFGVVPVSIQETEQGYELWVRGERMPLSTVFQA